MFLNDLYHMLDPVAFTLGPLTVRWYGIAYLLGFICAGVVMYRTARRWGLGLSVDDVFSIVIGVVFGIIIGARLFYVIFYVWGAGLSLSSPLEIFATWEGGMSFHGGLVGAVVGGALVCRHYGISVPTVCDLGVIGVVSQVIELPDGTRKVLVEGLERADPDAERLPLGDCGPEPFEVGGGARRILRIDRVDDARILPVLPAAEIKFQRGEHLRGQIEIAGLVADSDAIEHVVHDGSLPFVNGSARCLL